MFCPLALTNKSAMDKTRNLSILTGWACRWAEQSDPNTVY